VEIVEGDARDAFQLVRVMRGSGVRFVFNCIGDTFVPEAYEFPQRFFERNTLSALNVLRAASETQVERVLYVSSTEVYGETGADLTDENWPVQPVNTYAVSKLAADRLCHTYFLEHGLSTLVARIFNCYGPRATHPYVIPEIIRQLSQGSRLQLGNLEAQRDFTFVDDTARALIALMESDLPAGEVVNVGSGRAHSVTSLVKRLATIMDIPHVHVDIDPARLRRRDIQRFCADNTKLRRATDWAPRVPLDDGLTQTVEWFREHDSRWPWMRIDD
jgi:nucleoside-diphosphate-sugar epimerase